MMEKEKEVRIKLKLIEAIEAGALLTTLCNNEPNNNELSLLRSAASKITQAIANQCEPDEIISAGQDLDIQSLLGNSIAD